MRIFPAATGKIGAGLSPFPVDSAPEDPQRYGSEGPRHCDRQMHRPHLLSEVTVGRTLTADYSLSRQEAGFFCTSNDSIVVLQHLCAVL